MNKLWYEAYVILRAAAVNAMVGGKTVNHKWLILSELQAIQTQFTGEVSPDVVLNMTKEDFNLGSKGDENDHV